MFLIFSTISGSFLASSSDNVISTAFFLPFDDSIAAREGEVGYVGKFIAE